MRRGAPRAGLVKSRYDRSRNSRPSRFRHRASIFAQSDPRPNFRIASRISPNRALQDCETLLRWEPTSAFSLSLVADRSIFPHPASQPNQMLRFGKLNSLLRHHSLLSAWAVGSKDRFCEIKFAFHSIALRPNQMLRFGKLNSLLTAGTPSFFVVRLGGRFKSSVLRN